MTDHRLSLVSGTAAQYLAGASEGTHDILVMELPMSEVGMVMTSLFNDVTSCVTA